jgi:hypothetical protein
MRILDGHESTVACEAPATGRRVIWSSGEPFGDDKGRTSTIEGFNGILKSTMKEDPGGGGGPQYGNLLTRRVRVAAASSRGIQAGGDRRTTRFVVGPRYWRPTSALHARKVSHLPWATRTPFGHQAAPLGRAKAPTAPRYKPRQLGSGPSATPRRSLPASRHLQPRLRHGD